MKEMSEEIMDSEIKHSKMREDEFSSASPQDYEKKMERYDENDKNEKDLTALRPTTADGGLSSCSKPGPMSSFGLQLKRLEMDSDITSI